MHSHSRSCLFWIILKWAIPWGWNICKHFSAEVAWILLEATGSFFVPNSVMHPHPSFLLSCYTLALLLDKKVEETEFSSEFQRSESKVAWSFLGLFFGFSLPSSIWSSKNRKMDIHSLCWSSVRSVGMPWNSLLTSCVSLMAWIGHSGIISPGHGGVVVFHSDEENACMPKLLSKCWQPFSGDSGVGGSAFMVIVLTRIPMAVGSFYCKCYVIPYVTPFENCSSLFLQHIERTSMAASHGCTFLAFSSRIWWICWNIF